MKLYLLIEKLIKKLEILRNNIKKVVFKKV